MNQSSACNTRQIYNVPLPRPTSAKRKNSIIYDSKQLFNHPPLQIKKINAEREFRKRVKELLLAKAYYTLAEYYEDF